MKTILAIVGLVVLGIAIFLFARWTAPVLTPTTAAPAAPTAAASAPTTATPAAPTTAAPTSASAAPAPVTEVKWTPLGYFESTNFGFDLTNDKASVVIPGGLWRDPDNLTTMVVVVKPGVVLHLPGNVGWKGDRWLMLGWDQAALNEKPEETRKGSRLNFTPSLVIVDSDASLDQLVNYGPNEKRTLRSFGFEVKKHPAVP